MFGDFGKNIASLIKNLSGADKEIIKITISCQEDMNLRRLKRQMCVRWVPTSNSPGGKKNIIFPKFCHRTYSLD